MSRFLSLLMALACLGTSQAAQLVVQNGTGGPGTDVEINITFSAQGGLATAMQFDIEYDGDQLSLTVDAGPAASAAQKAVSSNQIDQDTLRVIVAGLNQNVIGDGAVVVVTVSVAQGAPNANYSISLTGVSATNQSGGSVPITAVSGTLTVSTGGGGGSAPLQVFPQYLDGILGGVANQTRVIIRNNSDERDTGTVNFLDSLGQPASVPIDGVPTSSVPYDLGPWTSTEVVTDGTSTVLLAGPLTVESDRGSESGIEATEIFTILGNFVSVGPAPVRSTHQIYVSFNPLENTGLAVYNPGGQDVTFDLRLLDSTGVARATPLAVLLLAGEHFSIFLNQQPLYEAFFAQNPLFNGTLNIRVRDGGEIALLGLIQRLDTGALISVSASANAAP